LPPGDTDGVLLDDLEADIVGENDTESVTEADSLTEPDMLCDEDRDAEVEDDAVVDIVPETVGLWVDESEFVGELLMDCVPVKLALSEAVDVPLNEVVGVSVTEGVTDNDLLVVGVSDGL
jgi:hypothetical protein